MNDLLEQLVGDLDDEETKEKPQLTLLNDGSYCVHGSVSLSEVAEKLGISLPIDDYETFGGFVFSSYGSVPDDGSQFEISVNELLIKVTVIKEHRIEEAFIKTIENYDVI